MADRVEFRFRIDVLDIDQLPMLRLAEYMADLAQLLGHTDQVHFTRLERGSAVLVQEIEFDAFPKVEERIASIAQGLADAELIKLFNRLDQRLQKDNAKGEIRGPAGRIIDFPGRDRPQPITYGPFREQGTLDGMVIGIRGKDDTVHVLLQDGQVTYSGCQTSRDVARRLGQVIYGPLIRAKGSGKWLRHEDGTWQLVRFDILDFDVLDDEPLSDVIERLRAVGGNEWAKSENPVRELLDLRGDGDGVH